MSAPHRPRELCPVFLPEDPAPVSEHLVGWGRPRPAAPPPDPARELPAFVRLQIG